MKSLLISILFCLLVINISGQALYTTSAGGVGAVYTMTNGAIMNQVIIYRLNSTGQLTWNGTVNTNGTGVNTTAPDALFSQGAMMVCSNYLFVVNPGSNSLSMFMINPMDGTQLTLISVQPTNGLFPISVTVNSNYACVLTGGTQTGIRCFAYNSSGLFWMSSFDRNLTSYISQSTPPTGPPETLSEILFSADGLSLIISVKGYNATLNGFLLFYQLTNNAAMLSMNPIKQTPSSGILPFSMTLVGANGLLITDPGAQGVLTQNYSSTSGIITNTAFTSINASIAGALCWSTYSPKIGNYYVIAAANSTIVELYLNLSSNSSPVQIINYYPIPNNPGALETTVVTLSGIDYLYVIGTTVQEINSYRLNAAGNASFNGAFMVQQGNMPSMQKIAGIAAYVQPYWSSTSGLFQTTTTTAYVQTSSSSASGFFQTTTIMFWSIAIFFYVYYV